MIKRGEHIFMLGTVEEIRRDSTLRVRFNGVELDYVSVRPEQVQRAWWYIGSFAWGCQEMWLGGALGVLIGVLVCMFVWS